MWVWVVLPIEVLVLVVVFLAVVKPALDRRELTRSLIRQRIVVNLKMGADGNQTSFHGTLWATDGRVLILKSATVFVPGAAPQDVPGESVIHREDVDWIQVVEGA